MMLGTLRELTEEYVNILNYCYSEDSISDELVDRLKNINEKWERKIQNLVYIAEEIDTNCAIIDREIKRLQKRRETREKNSNSIKEYIKTQMIVLEKTKIETPTHTITFRKSEPVDVDEEFVNYAIKNNLSALLRKIPEKIEPDKQAIKDYINSGKPLEHARIVQNQNLVIK